MTKKRKNPLDNIPDQSSTPESQPTSRRRRPSFNTPTDQINPADVQQIGTPEPKTTDPRKAGKYKREAITLPPAQVEHIKQLAEENQMSKLAFYRWLVDIALQQYDTGQRPDLPIIVAQEATKAHWSSKPEES